MADLTDDLGDWLTPLITQLEPRARSQLARSIAQKIRRSRQQGIAAQRNPDGTPFAPRKERKFRGKAGRIKRKAKMFTKLRTARYLKARGTASEASIEFAGRIARIARVHQYGLRDRPATGMPDVEYPQRELLGFSNDDLDMIRDELLAHLTL